MNSDKDVPSRPQVQEQVSRILASKVFANSATPSNFLARLVSDTLHDTVCDEHKLGVEVFGKRKDWIPKDEGVVRMNMRILRQKLAEYYASAGEYDPVIIGFPERGKHVAVLSYNPRTAAVMCHRLNIDLYERVFPQINNRNMDYVEEQFKKCIRDHPSFSPAFSSLAEILLTRAALKDGEVRELKSCLQESEELARRALQLNPHDWLAHIVSAGLHCCRFRWEAAEEAFNAALRIAPLDTHLHVLYAMYLCAVGRREESAHCFKLRLKDRPHDKFTELLFGFFLYLERDFENASLQVGMYSADNRDCLTSGIQAKHEIMQLNNWLAEILYACIRLATRRQPVEYVGQLVNQSALAQGVAIVGLAQISPSERPTIAYTARAILERMEQEGSGFGPVSIAMAYMGVGRFDEAVKKLEESCELGHPLMALLHVWPIFDPLRDRDDFMALVTLMNLPT
jgi:tetratricopeptide (TPR) repeat protein